MLKENISIKINTGYYLNKYGGLVNICKELSLNYEHALRSNKDDVKTDFYNVFKSLGYINIETYLKHGKYSKQSIKTAFGSVNNLMKELGIPLNMSRNESKDVVLNDIKKVCNKHKSSSSNIYRKHGQYCESVINRIFGSWENAMLEAGFEFIGKTYGKEEIDRQVTEIYRKYGFISKALVDDECDFTYQALKPYYKNRYEVSKMLGVKDAFCYSISSKAQVLHLILSELYSDVEVEKTWDWLQNDVTNRNLRVDFYIESLNLAIEYDGRQHFHFVKRFHKTLKEFEDSIHRDKIKEKLLAEHGIRLIRISYKDKISKSYVVELIKQAK